MWGLIIWIRSGTLAVAGNAVLLETAAGNSVLLEVAAGIAVLLETAAGNVVSAINLRGSKLV